MKILQDHKLTIIAGVVLTLIIAAFAVGQGGGGGVDPFGLARFAHIISGVTWIGLLYYFNFVQVPSLANVSAETKADLFKDGSIVRRALWWFRWGAMLTLLFGLALMHSLGDAAGNDIRIGAAFGVVMWFNVWFIIWPAQKRVIGLVEASADEKAAAGKRALIASRINTLLSIPMLFLMTSSAHFPIFN